MSNEPNEVSRNAHKTPWGGGMGGWVGVGTLIYTSCPPPRSAGSLGHIHTQSPLGEKGRASAECMQLLAPTPTQTHGRQAEVFLCVLGRGPSVPICSCLALSVTPGAGRMAGPGPRASGAEGNTAPGRPPVSMHVRRALLGPPGASPAV